MGEMNAPKGGRKGDWICPSCNGLIFASNAACRKCGTKRPDQATGAREPGDWECKCGESNFKKRAACHKCGLLKGAEQPEIEPKKQTASGDCEKALHKSGRR